MDECDFDLVIVGAGPAGSSAAFAASSQGVSVALLEKEKKLLRLLELVVLHGLQTQKNLGFQKNATIQFLTIHFVLQQKV